MKFAQEHIANSILHSFYPAIILIIFSLIPNHSEAQEKREIEVKIKKAEVPELAREKLNRFYDNPARVHWYREDHSGELSFEAKFKWKKKWHSVKFMPDGLIADIEIRRKAKEVPAEVRQKIWAYFDSHYTNFRVNKIQLQWSGSEEALKKALLGDETSNLIVRWEIEFRGKNQEENDLWEGLFDHSGELLQRSRVILITTDNLTY